MTSKNICKKWGADFTGAYIIMFAIDDGCYKIDLHNMRPAQNDGRPQELYAVDTHLSEQ